MSKHGEKKHIHYIYSKDHSKYWIIYLLQNIIRFGFMPMSLTQRWADME